MTDPITARGAARPGPGGRTPSPAPGQPGPDPVAILRSRSYLSALLLAAILGIPISAVAYGFLALVALNSAGLVPADVKAAITQISSFLIILAIGALGMKTSLLALARIGMAPVMLLVAETIFIALLVVGLIYGLRGVGL